MSDKKKLLAAVKAMPDDASWDDIIVELEIMATLDRSAAEADAGKLTSHNDVMNRFNKKCAKALK